MPTKEEQDELYVPTSAPALPSSKASHKSQQHVVVKEQQSEAKDTAVGLPTDITDNAETDRAVDAITSEEADEVLATEDSEREAVEDSMPKHRVRAFFSTWLGTKRGWKWTFAVLFVIAVGLGAMPTTRYWALNSAGVRCSLSLSTIDGDTQLSLPGVTVAAGPRQGETDHSGLAALYNLKLGPQTLTISRPGFKAVHQRLILGWGGNPLGSIAMKDTGEQYTVYVRDYVTGATITGASASDSGSQTLADKSGKITMTVSGNEDEQPIPITVSAPGYATENVSLSGTSTKPITVLLPPSQKEVYVANQSGAYNLCTSYVDGTDKQVLLAGTSTETSNISLAVSPDDSEVALVSSYDSSGAAQQTVTLVNVTGGAVQTLDTAAQIRLIGWVGSTIIYEEETAGGSTPGYSVISFDYATNSRDQLATSSQFTAVTLAAGMVYYAIPASASTTNDGFFAIQPDGSGKQAILAQDIWAVLRSSYAEFSIDTGNGWYDYTVGGNTASALLSAPSNLNSIQYLDSPDGKLSASVMNGQLQLYTVSSGRDQTLGTVTNAAYPLRWLTDDELIYRVTNGSTSADYVIDVNGGSPKFITDMTNTTGTVGS